MKGTNYDDLSLRILNREKLTKKEQREVLRSCLIGAATASNEVDKLRKQNALLQARITALETGNPTTEEKEAKPTIKIADPNCKTCIAVRSAVSSANGIFQFRTINNVDEMFEMIEKEIKKNKEEAGKQKEEEKEGEKNE